MSKMIHEDTDLQTIVQQARIAFTNAEPIEIKCISEFGELLRINTHEFFKKIMSQSKVSKIICKNSKAKIVDFILKSGNRFKSIKEFNRDSATIVSINNQPALKPQTPGQRSPPPGMSRLQEFNQIVSGQMKDKRDVMKEIVYDYPEIRKTI